MPLSDLSTSDQKDVKNGSVIDRRPAAMNHHPRLESAKAMQAAFHVQPEIADERSDAAHVGIYSWRTPPMEGFCLPESDDLIVALHLGGSRKVRAITESGLSRTVSIPGLVTVLPPMCRAAFRTAGSISLVTLHIPQAAMPNRQVRWPDSRLLASAPAHFAIRDAYASASMEALLRAARHETATSPDYIAKLTDALLCHLGNQEAMLEADRGGDADACAIGQLSLNALLALIDSRIASKLGIDEMAQATGLSRAGFNRAFRHATGHSFHQFLTQRRISRARQMLRQTRFDLAYISQELGFANQSHFAAAFKATQNCTPRQFRSGYDA